jgi:threonine dehydrogenase-like Zn-dependent dehydrogenase
VGVVGAAGDAVPDAQRWLGRRVFAFAPHASAVVVDAGDVMPVPAGVRAEDAVFLPSVETAVSLAHAAGPLLGERVLVVGQGLIGLLTAAALQHAGAGPTADVTVADVSDARLAVASAFNPTAATWNPAARPTTSRGGFDVCVEVSGNPRGLQTAIDCAAANGKVVVGSLFGDGLSPLRLGLRFHRSGVRLVASQVSHIPPELSGRWDKRRRFDVAWHVLQKVRPSRLLGADGAVPLRSADVLRAYERLERGEQVTALFVDSAP